MERRLPPSLAKILNSVDIENVIHHQASNEVEWGQTTLQWQCISSPHTSPVESKISNQSTTDSSKRRHSIDKDVMQVEAIIVQEQPVDGVFNCGVRRYDQPDTHIDNHLHKAKSVPPSPMAARSAVQLRNHSLPLPALGSEAHQHTFLAYETPVDPSVKSRRHDEHAYRKIARSQALPTNLTQHQFRAGRFQCEHLVENSGRRCPSSFPRRRDLRSHEIRVHKVEDKRARCHLCQGKKTFARSDVLIRHMRIAHPIIDMPSNREGWDGDAASG